MEDLRFDRDFSPEHGRAVEVAPGIRRITAPNEGPFTFRGTNTWLVGTDRLAVIDPGPDDAAHLTTIQRAAGGAPVETILVTHTHRDHSPGAAPLSRMLGGIPVLGAAPIAPAAETSGSTRLDQTQDGAYRPDRVLGHGERLVAGGATLETIATPGHAANHLAFALPDAGVLFSGDHVMGWSTTVVAPPDGRMADYMASLDLLLGRRESLYLPGHGGAVRDAHALVRGLKAHRRMRERAILTRLEAGDRTIPAIVSAIYRDVDPRLHAAAALSTLAHLEWLTARGLVETADLDGEARLVSLYRLGASGVGGADASG